MNTAAASVSPAAPALPGFVPLPPITGGWHDSTLDLLLGLEVRDLGPVEWLDQWDGAFLPN